MWPVKPKRSRSGPVSSPARGGRADQRERCQVERDRRGTGALAHDDVDAEVLHRHVQQLLGGPRDAMNLVDEQHLALGEAGEQRRQVAGAFDRRAARHPDWGAELGSDDHREAGLAEPGRTGEQDVVGRTVAPQRALEHQRKLLAHLRLADELGEAPGPQTGLDLALGKHRQGRYQVFFGRGHAVTSRQRPAFPRWRPVWDVETEHPRGKEAIGVAR